ncbi:MAG: DUF302 domain-containing protein [Halobacteriaceae archaeon]
MSPNSSASLTVKEDLHLEIDADEFRDVVLYVQLEHELAGFETVQVTRLDELIEGSLNTTVERSALIIVCHAKVALKTIEINPQLVGFLPCTTAVYETTTDNAIHIQHFSAAKTMRDLVDISEEDQHAIEELVNLTGEYMDQVWDNLEANFS